MSAMGTVGLYVKEAVMLVLYEETLLEDDRKRKRRRQWMSSQDMGEEEDFCALLYDLIGDDRKLKKCYRLS
jgi:hypothetical protein